MNIITPHDPWSPKKKKTWQEELKEQNEIAEAEARMLAEQAWMINEAKSATTPPDAPNDSVATLESTVAGSNANGGLGVPPVSFLQRQGFLVAGFTFLTSSGAAPTSASFVNTSTNAGPGTLSYLWDLGSGSLTSTATTPAHQTYTAPGTYTITLTVTESEYGYSEQATGQFIAT